MGTVIIATIGVLLIFELLKLIVRIIFAVENMKDSPYKQDVILMPTIRNNKLLMQLKWFFVYARFLVTCQAQIWKIRIQRIYLYFRNRKVSHGKYLLRIINRIEVPFKDSAHNPIKDSAHNPISDHELHRLYDRKVTNTSFYQNFITQFLLFLCSSENQIKLKRKTDQHF